MYGRLTVVGSVRRNGREYYECLCSCGNTKVIDKRALTRKTGATRSCGCLSLEAASIPKILKHGMSHTVEHSIWRGIIDRCNNPNNKAYKHYGGKGIGVCKEWVSANGFMNFYTAMGTRPSAAHSIDRTDNRKGYSPDNCRWATQKEQIRNSSKVVKVTVQDLSYCIAEWAEVLGKPYSTVRAGVQRHGARYIERLLQGREGEPCKS